MGFNSGFKGLNGFNKSHFMDTYKVIVMALCDYTQSGLHNKNVETRLSINNN